MLKISEIPCLIIGYQRVAEVEAQIQKLYDFGIERIYVAIDGQKEGSPPKFSHSNFEALSNKNGKHISTWIRNENLGLAASVVTAIDWFFQNEDQGIILEDDLNFDESFLEYVAWGLPEIATRFDCLMISGNNFFPLESDGSQIQNSWCNYPLIWGWATSRAKWQIMRELTLKQFSWQNSKMAIEKKGFWFTGNLRAQHGLIDSWAIPLAANFYNNQYFCLLPSVALVENRGNDHYATHTKTFREIYAAPLEKSRFSFASSTNSDKAHLSNIQNELIERHIFRIRKKHIFLPVYVYLQIIGIKERGPTLVDRINAVIIPS